MRRVLIQAATTLCVLVCAAAAVALAVDGTTGPDALFGTQGNDRIEARGGDDTVSGLGGVDFIDGGFGNDVLYGEGTCPISYGGSCYGGYYYCGRPCSVRSKTWT